MSERQIPKVTKSYAHWFVGGPASGRTRRECTSATTDDGVWTVTKLDDIGTPWIIRHNPTGKLVDWDGRGLGWYPSTSGYPFGTLQKTLEWIARHADTWTDVAA